MARQAKGVWFRTGRGWFATISGKNVRLVKTLDNKDKQAKEQAERKWHGLCLTNGVASEQDDAAVIAVFGLFLDHVERQNKPMTYKTYRSHLDSFVVFLTERFGDQTDAKRAVRVKELKPAIVSQWIDSKDWKGGSKRVAICIVQTALNWALHPSRQLINRNPLARMPKPPSSSRGADCVISEAEHLELMAHAEVGFRSVLFALHQTGCRPQDIRNVKVSDFSKESAEWTLAEHKTSRTGRRKVIGLTPSLVELCNHLAVGKSANEPLFQTTLGCRWTSTRIAARFKKVCKAANINRELTPYGYRHAFIVRALKAGMDATKVATIVGHKDTAMIQKHYGHMDANRRLWQADMDRIIPATNVSELFMRAV